MAKRRFKRSRRVGKELNLISRIGKAFADKVRTTKRPGQHGAAKKSGSDYARQLNEKQAAKYEYGLQEKQFRRLYEEASRRDGVTGENLFSLLESRLDNVVYRLGFGSTRAEARQLVKHKAIEIVANGSESAQTVNVPSYNVNPGDVIRIREKAKNQTRIKDSLQAAETATFPEWVEVDTKGMTGTFKRVPDRSELTQDINEQLIVELYSK